ncbi:MAG: succinate dehydrogenase/fumarate reductase iron-sulfur subunit [Pseudomonadota bacterium]
MKERVIQLEVFRYNPDTDTEGHYQHYEVSCLEEWVVLDALNKVKETLDPTLNFRWSCHMAVCGSCGMMINGEPKLACHTFLRNYPGTIRVEPLVHFPVERDLVTAPDDFMEKLKRVKPYIIRKQKQPIEQGEYKQTPKELLRFRQYAMCINCTLCYAACPEYGLTKHFIGPAALALAHRYNQDSRDQGRDERQEVVATKEGIWECTFVGACSEVCPVHVDPASALQQMKIASSFDWIKEHLLPGGGK